jgi:hypothetical protein
MFLGSKAQPLLEADNLAAIWTDCLDNVGSSTSHTSTGLQGLLWEYLYLFTSLFLWLYCPLKGFGRFFSSLIPFTIVRTPWTEISPSQGCYLHVEPHNHRINAHRLYASSEIRTQELSVWACEDSSYLRPCGHCERPLQPCCCQIICFGVNFIVIFGSNIGACMFPTDVL